MDPGTLRLFLACIGGMILAVALNAGFTLWQTQQSQHKWCTTIETLNAADQAAKKAPPSQKPKGAYSLALIKDFQQLQGQLGC
jgi:hypothetical protein